MRTARTGRLLAGLIGLLMMIGEGPATAQDLPSEAQEPAAERQPAAEIESIVVTATKRETNLMSTPVAVTALTQDQLERDGVQDALDLGSLVPNMQVGLSPSDSGVSVTVRGISSNNFTELGDPTVAIHVDGMYSPRPQGGLALLHDVDRVEILRGPQGTLFGRNSTSGSINIITARPEFEEYSGVLEVEYGNFDHKLARGVLNVPINYNLALRGSFMIDRTDSYIRQYKDEFDLNWDTNSDGDFDDPTDVRADGIPNTDQRRNKNVGDDDAYFNSDRWAFRLSALWTPTPEIDWLVTYDRYQDDGAGTVFLKDCDQASGTFFACDRSHWSASINTPGEIDMTIQTWRSELSWSFTDGLVLEHRVAFADQERYQVNDGDGGLFTDPDHPAYGITRGCCGTNFGLLIRDEQAIRDAGFEPFAKQPWDDLQLTTRDSNYQSVVTELQLKSDYDSSLQWIAGLFYMQEENDIRFDVENPFCCGQGIPLAQSFVQPDRQIHSTALFGQLDYAPNERLNLTLGYRYTWDQKEDNGGSNHETIGYWVNPGLFGGDFWYESWALIGVNDNWDRDPALYQANALRDDFGSLDPNFPNEVPGSDNTTSARWGKGTWKLGADYDVTDNLFVYGYVATGFKSGGFGDKVNICDCEGGLTTFPFDPEENLTFELGMKTSLLGGTLNLLGNVFFSQFDDMQRTQWSIVGRSQPTDSQPEGREIGTLLTTNIAAAEILGVEFEFDWRPWDGGRIFGWISYLDAEITDNPDYDDGWFCFERAYLGLTPCPAEDPSQRRGDNSLRRPYSVSGNQLPWSPKWSLTVNVEHNWWVGDGLRLSPYVSVSWTDEMFFDDRNFDEEPFHSGQEEVTTVNASLRLIDEGRRWGAELYVYNATDERVKSWVDPGGPGYVRANYFPPRTYGVKLRKDF